MLQGAFRSWRKNWVMLAWLLLLPSSAPAKTLLPIELMDQMLKAHQSIGQFVLQTEVTVYDPEAFIPLNQEGDPGIPYELSARGYRQTLTFLRDELIVIESRDKKNKLLHLYLETPKGRFSKSFERPVSLSELDTAFTPLAFYTKRAASLRKHLGGLGIAPLEVTIDEVKGRILYRFGWGEEYILVDPDSFRIEEVHRLVQAGGRYYPLREVFSHWHSIKKQVPLRVDQYIQGRLFKQIQVKSLSYRGMRRKILDLKKKYRARFSELQPNEVYTQPINLEELIQESKNKNARQDVSGDQKNRP